MPAVDRAITEFANAPSDAYWALRVCALSHQLRDAAGLRLHARAIACVASKDPRHVASESHLGLAMNLGVRGLSSKALRSIERLVRIPERSLAAHVKGKLWVAAMSGLVDAEELAAYGRAAMAHLGRVKAADRTAAFREALCIACAWSSYETLLTEFDAYLAGVSHYSRHAALILVLEAAARKRDWRTYDRYRVVYAELPPDAARAHSDCSVLNLDGLRALARKDAAEAQRVLRSLVERGRNVMFLGTPDTLVFVEALAKRRLFPKESRDYLLAATENGRDVPRTFAKPLRHLLEHGEWPSRRAKAGRSAPE